MTPDIVRPPDQYFTIMYDGPSGERMFVIRGISKEHALYKFHKKIDLERREDYPSDEAFNAALGGLHKTRERHLTLTPCTFDPEGIALIWER